MSCLPEKFVGFSKSALLFGVSLLPAKLLAAVTFLLRSSKNSSQETAISQRSARTRTQVKGAGILITAVTCSQNRAHYLYCRMVED